MSYLSSVLCMQKGIVALTIIVTLVCLGALTRRLIWTHEDSHSSKPRSKNSLLMELLANMSESLDRIETGLDDITARASAAKVRLIKLNALRSQLRPCALVKDEQDHANRKKRFKVPR